MAARNELYRKTMDLLDDDLDGNEDPNLEDIVQRYFQKRNSRVSKLDKKTPIDLFKRIKTVSYIYLGILMLIELLHRAIYFLEGMLGGRLESP